MMTHNAEPCLSLLLTGHEQGADRELASHQRLVPAHGVSWQRGGEDDGAIQLGSTVFMQRLPVRFAPPLVQ
jgi:hypothetical protein